jgi:myosin heavy subunit
MDAHLVPKILQWTQHDPNLAEEIKSSNVPSGWTANAKYIFLRDSNNGFVPCKLTNDIGCDPLTCVTSENESLSIKKSKYDKPAMFFPFTNPASLGIAFDDLVNLDDLNEATILHSLYLRFQYDRFYTSVGTILVSLNPFKWVAELYTEEVMKFYRDNRFSPSDKPPHVFDLAERSFGGLLEDGKSQAIIISGESGAGKTEAAKKCVSYLAAAAEQVNEGDDGNKGEAGETKNDGSTITVTVADRIMAASPVLEAFGNAKTLRNNNSSRFGKWMVIEFSARSYKIVGCKNDNYLLEKSRVVSQDEGERNFHIFYQLLLGSNDDILTKYKLNDNEPSKYHYVGQSGCLEVESKSDEDDFNEVIEAMNDLNFDDSEK